MAKPDDIVDIFLQPGDYYFGERQTRIRTLLGSCVSITVWHPKRLIGGMCHFMLPTRKRSRNMPLDGRYADEAMSMFLRDITAAGTRPDEYEVKMFGGGNMFPELGGKNVGCTCTDETAPNCRNISCRNERAARKLARLYGFTIQASNLGGVGHRQIFFEIWTGNVWVKHNPAVLGESQEGKAGR